MEGSNQVVKHIVIVKFKEEVSPERKEQLIRGFANLVSLIKPMKAFHWGTNVSAENLHQGFTHVFESTFENVEGIAEYVAHPAHVEFANVLLPTLDKVIAIDYKPSPVVDLDFHMSN
ncbi:stress-response A/B barrel domain-containing protein HS1 [Aristolochia californica]|uniref:stress-response A/B barrel domain-containing protein HS1 n=1 Tax=Aristolochia californica TaxID=171875 RepID=UPI0035D599C4